MDKANHPPEILEIYARENSPEELEVLGRKITASQAIEILKIHSQKPEHQWKLSPLLVGITHSIFLEMLNIATPEQLKTLQKESANESIQHHLTVLTHDIAYATDIEEKKLEQLEQEIESIDPQFSAEDLKNITLKLQKAEIWQEKTASLISRALSLAWNTGRPDLVERLTALKEHCIRTDVFYIGIPPNQDRPTSGLYAALEKKLNEFYGNRSDPSDIEALRDDEPSIEALTKLSLWYLKDYWAIGLLPEFTKPEELELDSSHTDYERRDHVEGLMKLTQKNLDKLGLRTVQDLKKAHIYSKAALQEYIAKRLKR
jgi:hypothetical protein